MARRNGLPFTSGLLVGLALSATAAFLWIPREDPELARFREVRDFVHAEYVREVSSREVLDGALEGLIESLDAYSRYYDADAIAGLERETTGRYRGIGAVFTGPVEEGRVLFPLEGSPAERAGLRVGDLVLSIDGVELAQLEPGGFRERLQRASDSEIQFDVEGLDGELRSLTVRPEQVVDPTVRHVRWLDTTRGIGYVAISSFTQETPREFDAALSALGEQGLRGLVVDVRGNLGGVLRASVALANRFVASGTLVSTEGRGSHTVYEADSRQAQWAGLPLVVLTDGESASASEVFAGALQDHRAAVVVGQPSYGKGMVQKVRRFGSDEADVKLTTAYYYTPAHRNIERNVPGAWEKGLLPDVEIVLERAETLAIHRYLADQGPPPSAIPAISELEQHMGRTLVAPPPPDPQLDAALRLLRGEHPVVPAAAPSATPDKG